MVKFPTPIYQFDEGDYREVVQELVNPSDVGLVIAWRLLGGYKGVHQLYGANGNHIILIHHDKSAFSDEKVRDQQQYLPSTGLLMLLPSFSFPTFG